MHLPLLFVLTPFSSRRPRVRGRAALASLPPALILGLATGCLAHTPPMSLPDGRPDPEGIATLEAVEIGGVEQWLLIRGRRADAPLLLRLHGGPGAADMPVTRHFNGALEDHFVVVSWDQRGAGKSNPRSFDPTTMTFERFVEDGHELTRYLKERFGRDRIFLMGHSWGTQLGLRLIHRYPDDYAGYIGVSQSVDQRRAVVLAHRWLSGRIAEAGDETTGRELAALGTPPYRDHGDFVAFVGLLDRYGANMDVGFGTLAWVAVTAPEYSARDLLRWLRGARRGSGPMWDEPAYRDFDALTGLAELSVPSHFFMGARDLNTPLALAQEYADSLEDPGMARVVTFEESGHVPFMAEPERFHREVVEALLEPSLEPRMEPSLEPSLEPEPGALHDPRPPRGLSWAALPYVFYSPDTRFGGGVYGGLYRPLAPDLPASSAEAAFTVTARQQYIVETYPSLHLPGGLRADATVQAREYPNRFYGVGPRVDGSAEDFTTRTLAARTRLQWEVLPGFRVGPQASLRWERLTDAEPGSFMEDGLLAGIRPDVRSGRWVGLGVLATQDSRNHLLNPRSGQYVELSFVGRPTFLGSTTEYGIFTAEVRRFHPVGSGSTVGVQAFVARATGEVPPLLLPALGGRAQLRGYPDGGLRDRALAAAQVEWRVPLRRRLNGALFAEVGQVAPGLSHLDWGDAAVSAGGGLRFILGAGAPIRVDLAHGRRGTGLYMTIGHPF
ncbi:MAG: alpha/beta fold hydrolase [Gemmatimonadales bacterium]|nr:MAG: alpha/beta fold hydrolase [Gemmatimonadales bacterium]